MFAYSCSTSETPDRHSPIGQAAANLAVRGCHRCPSDADEPCANETTTVWNRNTGRLLLAMQRDQVDTLVDGFVELLAEHRLPGAETVFNQLLGVNAVPLSEPVIDVFLRIGLRLAELYGVGRQHQPTVLINLNAMLVYRTDLSRRAFALDGSSPLEHLADMYERTELVGAIAAGSVLLEAYAYWDRVFIFTDAEFGYRTASGRPVSHLLGDKRMMADLWRPIDRLVTGGLAGEADEYELLAELMTDVALDDEMDGRFERLFSGLEADELPSKFEL